MAGLNEAIRDIATAQIISSVTAADGYYSNPGFFYTKPCIAGPWCSYFNVSFASF
jgi:hypothetical protein